MQSGISASAELKSAFHTLLASPTDRGLLATISAAPETLVPGARVPSGGSGASLAADLAHLAPLISPAQAAYVLLRDDASPAKCVGVTYVPDAAPVRQKMLFAATRLTLVRELGTEHFSSTLFATTPAELTAEGWAKHEAHGALAAPLTDEERSLEGIRAAEAEESRGTGARQALGGKGMSLPVGGEAEAALRRLGGGELALVQLKIDIASETLVLAATAAACTPASLAGEIDASSPRYSIYSHADPSTQGSQLLFLYTCPSSSSIKERMLYAASRAITLNVTLPDLGLQISKRLEASSPDEITEDVVLEELGVKAQVQAEGAGAPAPSSRGFARPKRPGKR